MSTRLRRALENEPSQTDNTNYQYGMARKIPNNDKEFEFSNFGLCDNWELKRYEDVLAYQSLDPVRCTKDNKFYIYYKFLFK